MQESTITIAATQDPIDAALAKRERKSRTRKAVSSTAAELRDATERYAGGTPAEQSSYQTLKVRLKARLRAEYFAGIGRRIDLMALLNQQRQIDEHRKAPLWALVDPRKPIGRGNESHAYLDSDIRPHQRDDVAWVPMGGKYAKGIVVGGVPVPVTHECDVHWNSAMGGYTNVRVDGMPALPKRVRELLGDVRLKHANMVGVLYQPHEWVLVNPDPAVVVEWKDLPGQYFALCVWGGDRARIMEFVD